VQYRYLIHSPFLTQPHWRTDPYAKRVENDRGNGYITSSEFDWGTDRFEMPAWNELVIYELHVGSFYDLSIDSHPCVWIDLYVVDIIYSNPSCTIHFY
jgi:1,4-alpha-glucan branching enzyme